MTPIAPHVGAFLQERLPAEQGASENTRIAYADALRLLFGFVSFAIGSWQMSYLTKDYDFWELFVPQLWRGAGLMFAMVPITNLELGTLPAEEFAPRFAHAIGLPEERADGLVDRLFAGADADVAMLEAVAAAKRAGVRTGLISNSWGEALKYDRDRFPELFDAWVGSGS